MSRLRIPLLLVVALLASGCLGLGKKGPTLQVVSAPLQLSVSAEPATPIDRQLIVAMPGASAMLDGRRIVARPAAGELAYLSGVAWADNAPRLLQDALVEALPRTGLRAVERQGQGLRGDLLLNLHLHRFEIDFSDGASARGQVEIEALLIDVRSGRALARRRFEASKTAADRAPAVAAQGLLQAAGLALDEMLPWIRTIAAEAPTQLEF